MEDNTFAINNILLNILPNVLNNIILEYLIPPEHTFEKIYKDDNYVRDDIIYCENDGYVYAYDKNGLNIISHQNKNEICFSIGACVYQNNIYIGGNIQDNTVILVFNNKCEQIRKITVEQLGGYTHTHINMLVVADKIYVSYHRDYAICVYDLYGSFVKEIELKNKFYNMKLYNTNIYVLTYDETISEYSYDGDLINEHKNPVNGTCIDDFCVIDNVIYILIDNCVYNCTDKHTILAKYDICQNMHVENNILYLYDNIGICTYKINRKKILNHTI